jgi:membrane-bound lytic murein transglycosylase D
LNRYFIIIFWVVSFFGCTGKETTKPTPSQPEKVPLLPSVALAELAINNDSILVDLTNGGNNGTDPYINKSLEQARKHYMTALAAGTDGDSIRSADEFELAINILDELSYYPNIEKNKEFNDLSLSIIEDYETYIASIDSLGDETSIFALREKLNQLLETAETPDQYTLREVIPGLQVPLVINGLVAMNIDYFSGKGHHHMERWLRRSGKYFPMMKRIFAEEKVPEELIYLSMIESGLNPVARSWAKAVGIWQFIKGTGKLYGLGGNWWYDHRRDPEKATRAAAQHLRDLYIDFGDWHLALAAYNSGAGNVKRAVRKSGTNVFWFLRKHLPRETRNYVPQYIAAAVVGLNPGKYGFDVQLDPPFEYDLVTIDDCVDLSVLAQCAGTDLSTMRELNAELIQNCTPPGYKGYKLKIPVGSFGMFLKNYAQVPTEKKRDWATHTVKRGETIGAIAKKYGLSKSLLAKANNISLKRKLLSGASLVIPVSGKSIASRIQTDTEISEKKNRQVKIRNTNLESSNKTKISYKVKKGDTLGEIAAMYDVRVTDLRIWNDIPYGKHIKAGAIIDIYVSKEKAVMFAQDSPSLKKTEAVALQKADRGKKTTSKIKSHWVVHTVKSGETLGKIANKYGVTIRDIKNWNGFRNDLIKPDQELEIYIVPDTPNISLNETSKPTAKPKSDQANKNSKDIIEYKVKKGDTLYTIAVKYNVSVDKLKQWNNFKGSKLNIGQLIIIYTDREA